MTNTPLADLVCSARDGDQQAWAELVAQYQGLLLSIGRAHGLSSAECADAAQAAWVQLVCHIHALNTDTAVGGWLATTTRRECYRMTRSRTRECPVAEPAQIQADGASGPAEPLSPRDPQDTFVENWERSNRRRRLAVAVENLPTTQARLVKLLLAEESLSYGQISAKLQMPMGSIGPIRRRAFTALQTALSGDSLVRCS